MKTVLNLSNLDEMNEDLKIKIIALQKVLSDNYSKKELSNAVAEIFSEFNRTKQKRIVQALSSFNIHNANATFSAMMILHNL